MLPVAFRLSSAPRPPRIVSAAPFLRHDETLGARAFKPVLAGKACPPASATYQKLVVIQTIWIHESAAHRLRCNVCSLLFQSYFRSRAALQAENPRRVAHSKAGIISGE